MDGCDCCDRLESEGVGMNEESESLTSEIRQLKLSILKAAVVALQALVTFGVTAGSTYFAGGVTGRQACFAGGLAACGYVAGNLQRTGGVALTLDGLKK